MLLRHVWNPLHPPPPEQPTKNLPNLKTAYNPGESCHAYGQRPSSLLANIRILMAAFFFKYIAILKPRGLFANTYITTVNRKHVYKTIVHFTVSVVCNFLIFFFQFHDMINKFLTSESLFCFGKGSRLRSREHWLRSLKGQQFRLNEIMTSECGSTLRFYGFTTLDDYEEGR